MTHVCTLDKVLGVTCTLYKVLGVTCTLYNVLGVTCTLYKVLGVTCTLYKVLGVMCTLYKVLGVTCTLYRVLGVKYCLNTFNFVPLILKRGDEVYQRLNKLHKLLSYESCKIKITYFWLIGIHNKQLTSESASLSLASLMVASLCLRVSSN